MSNVYTDQIRSQGKEPSKAASTGRTFPYTVGLRTFQSEEEYQEALADFINGR